MSASLHGARTWSLTRWIVPQKGPVAVPLPLSYPLPISLPRQLLFLAALQRRQRQGP